MVMASGGARFRSGPAADPNSLRQDRKDAKQWVTLPAEGFQGEIPVCPLADASAAEVAFWEELWRRPQAVMWARLRMERQVASYVRTYLEANAPGAVSGLKAAMLRMEAEIGLSLPGMHGFGWKFSEDELAAKRDDVPAVSAPAGARARLQALGGGS